MFEILLKTAVDTVQATKKIAVDMFVKHEGLAKSLTEFVDTQTEYTKQALDASIKVGTNVYTVMSDKTFYTDTMKSMQDSAQAIINTQKKGK